MKIQLTFKPKEKVDKEFAKKVIEQQIEREKQMFDKTKVKGE